MTSYKSSTEIIPLYLIDRKRCKFIDQLQCDTSFSTLLLVYGFNSVSSVYVS